MNRRIAFDRLGGPDVLDIVDADLPAPGEGHVRVRMSAVGLNRAELLFFGGQYLMQPDLPGSPVGYEGAGVVEAVGPGAGDHKPGDRVCVTPMFDQVRYGVIADAVNIPATALEPIPDGVDDIDAAAFWMAYGTAYGLLALKGGLDDGEARTIVLNAASSSVGLALIQLAKAWGHKTIALTTSPSKRDTLASAGAEYVVVTQRGGGDEALAGQIMEASDERGFDLFLDAVGGPALADVAPAAGFEAKMVQYGLLSGEVADLPIDALLGKGASLSGFHLIWHLLQHEDRRLAARDALLPLWSSGHLAPKIDKVFSGLDSVCQGYKHLSSNAQVGKVVVRLDRNQDARSSS